MAKVVRKVKISSVEDVKNFVNSITRFEGSVDLGNGHYIVDAKSIMGVFSLDLSQAHDLSFDAESEDECKAVLDSIAQYIVG